MTVSSLVHVALDGPRDRTLGAMTGGTAFDRPFIDKYIYQEVDQMDLHDRMTIVEVGDINYTDTLPCARRLVLRYSKDRNMWHDRKLMNKEHIIHGDLNDPYSLPGDLCSLLILPQTLQYCADVLTALKSAYRMLRRGGRVIITMACSSPRSVNTETEDWRDTWRMMPGPHYKSLMHRAGFTNCSQRWFGNFPATIFFHAGVTVEEAFVYMLPEERKSVLSVLDEDYPLVVGFAGTRGN